MGLLSTIEWLVKPQSILLHTIKSLLPVYRPELGRKHCGSALTALCENCENPKRGEAKAWCMAAVLRLDRKVQPRDKLACGRLERSTLPTLKLLLIAAAFARSCSQRGSAGWLRSMRPLCQWR